MQHRILVHQALFGYDAGHHLLRASTNLPAESSRALSVATDLSGSSPKSGFDASITGMPVTGTEYYALFCTWLAPEMPRPGCVWSHVLLIDIADLAVLPDLSVFSGLFCRPGQNDLSNFGQPLELVAGDREPSARLADFNLQVARLILVGLYERATTVVVPAESSEEHSALIFAVWSQQWPRLRRNFRFSSGSFSDRGKQTTAFDLQIAPRANRRAWLDYNESFALELEEPQSHQSHPTEEWLECALIDLLTPDKHGFRTFLRENGADVEEPRAAFAILARVFSARRDAPVRSWSELLGLVGGEFPKPSDAVSLKRHLTSPPPKLSVGETADWYWGTLEKLYPEPALGSFAGAKFDYSLAVEAIWTRKRAELIKLLSGGPAAANEDRWRAIALTVVKCMGDSDAAWLWDRHPGMLPVLIRIDPWLATRPNIWSLPGQAAWRVFSALESQHPPLDVWRGVVDAMLEARSATVVRDVAEAAPTAVFDGFIKWLEKHPTEGAPGPWRDTLAELARERIRDTNIGPLQLALCASLVPPAVAERVSADRPEVEALTEARLENLPAALRLPVAFWLLSIGLRGSGSAAAAAIACGFFSAHAALATETEPPESWRLLKRQLPEFLFWEWDRCGKLRDSTRGWLRRNRAKDTFVNAARSPTELQLALSIVS